MAIADYPAQETPLLKAPYAAVEFVEDTPFGRPALSYGWETVFEKYTPVEVPEVNPTWRDGRLVDSDTTVAAHSSALLSRQLRTAEAPSEQSRVERANSTRLALLVRKFVERELTTEEDARLMIATERVRKLMPRFGAEEMETWASLMEEVQRAEALREEVRALLSE